MTSYRNSTFIAIINYVRVDWKLTWNLYWEFSFNLIYWHGQSISVLTATCFANWCLCSLNQKSHRTSNHKFSPMLDADPCEKFSGKFPTHEVTWKFVRCLLLKGVFMWIRLRKISEIFLCYIFAFIFKFLFFLANFFVDHTILIHTHKHSSWRADKVCLWHYVFRGKFLVFFLVEKRLRDRLKSIRIVWKIFRKLHIYAENLIARYFPFLCNSPAFRQTYFRRFKHEEKENLKCHSKNKNKVVSYLRWIVMWEFC